MNKENIERPLFENLEDCQTAISILMRKDAIEMLQNIDLEQAGRLFPAFEQIHDVLAERLPTKKPSARPSPTQPGEDRLLNVHDAARIIGFSEQWLYRNAKDLPFTRVLRNGRLRFSAGGIQGWMAEQRAY